jgi:tRNA (guanine37-N1)-methyltransferase
MALNFHIITLFPELCQAYTDASILGRAQKAEKGKGAKVKGKKISVHYYNPRDYTADKHRTVDDRPYGGGPGMVMKAEPIVRAWETAVGRKRTARVKTLVLSPRGRQFTANYARELAREYDHLVLISGRYEGIDSRVFDMIPAEPISVGDYVLTGGELPALTIVDAVARQVPGVLGTWESLEEERSASEAMYTRPEVIDYKKTRYPVPEVLVRGNHAEIEQFRKKHGYPQR